jgi:hypothetical protein
MAAIAILESLLPTPLSLPTDYRAIDSISSRLQWNRARGIGPGGVDVVVQYDDGYGRVDGGRQAVHGYKLEFKDWWMYVLLGSL